MKQKVVANLLISAALSVAVAFMLAVRFFDYGEHELLDRIFLVTIPAFALALTIYSLISRKGEFSTYFKTAKRWIKISLVIFAMPLLVFFVQSQPVLFSSVNLLLAAAVILGAAYLSRQVVPVLRAEGSATRILSAWVLAIIPASFVTAFLGNFYVSWLEIFFPAFLAQLVCVFLVYYLLGKVAVSSIKSSKFWIAFAVYSIILFLSVNVLLSGSKFPTVFDVGEFLLDVQQIGAFSVAVLVSLIWFASALGALKAYGIGERLRQTKVFAFIDQNLPGILLAGLFFTVYIQIASMLNRPAFDVDDIFFDADGLNWRFRFTTENWADYYWRSIHPIVLLLIRPMINFVSAFLRGDMLHAAFLVVAFTGALCVFLGWMFIRKATGNSVYAILVASILGASASHLIFGSLIETYIFLAASLILFYVLLLDERPFAELVLAGLLSIGITLTNFAQNVFAFFVIKPRPQLIIRYVCVVLVLLILLGMVNNLVYPGSNPLFFIPSSFLAEKQNFFPLNMERIQGVARSFLFYNVVAPNPILYTKDIPFTQFRFFKPEIHKLSSYDTPIQIYTSWFWLALLAIAGISFLVSFKNNKHLRISIAFLGCILFNVVLHLRYGKELFLYSPNWTYALILLLGLSWERVSGNKWFLVLLLVFLGFLVVNDITLLNTLMSVSSLHFIQ